MNANPEPGRNAKYTWREVERVDPPKRCAVNRVADFSEAVLPYDEATAQQQASRCIQCPNPNCVAACPLETPIVELLTLTADGNFREAAELFFSTSHLPELASHTCFGGRRCETVCVLGGKADPIPVRSITRFLLDYGWKHGLAEPAIAAPTGKRVAVIGSGICGLVAADVLSRRGHAVTVFDSRQKPGGRVVNGLPGFRVDKVMVQRRVDLLKQRGIEFRMGVICGRDITLPDLRQSYDAVLLAFGRADPVPLEIPGAHLRGVFQAYPFLIQSGDGVMPRNPVVEVRGRRVVVLGGGDTAMDALRTAIRCGAREARCIYRRDEAGLAADGEEYANAVEEGAQFEFLSQATGLIGNVAGEVASVRCARMERGELDESGRFSVKPVAGPGFEVPADVVLVAYGFKAPGLPRSGGFAEVMVDDGGSVLVDGQRQTNVPGVFACGSVVRGAAPLSEAVRDARAAAVAIDGVLRT